MNQGTRNTLLFGAVVSVTMSACGPTEIGEGGEATIEAQQELSGTSCAAMINDDTDYCIDIGELSCSYDDNLCRKYVYDRCKQASINALARCNLGYADVYRTYTSRHDETKVYISGRVEGKFIFSSKPVSGASAKPVYRCEASWGADFPSRDPNCEGYGPPISALGFDWPTSKAGVKPVFRCRLNGDHFLSWSSTCEGVVNEGIIGYAIQ